jgi:hypothetical protein
MNVKNASKDSIKMKIMFVLRILYFVRVSIQIKEYVLNAIETLLLRMEFVMIIIVNILKVMVNVLDVNLGISMVLRVSVFHKRMILTANSL